jgi:Ca2+-binding RTX toxin-like protein
VGSGYNDALTGHGAANILSGGLGDDTLEGRELNDTLDGGSGTDTVSYASSTSGVMIGSSGATDGFGGTDTFSSPFERYIGSAHGDAIFANGLLDGGAGDDSLDGSFGGVTDTLRGGADNDWYLDDPLDVFLENPGEGTDTIISVITRTLGENFENLVLQGSDALNGTGNSLNNSIAGNSGANLLVGFEGSDTLTGGIGMDSLDGGAGDDTHVVSVTGMAGASRIVFVPDAVTEAAAGGTDTVYTTSSYTLPDEVENLELTGTAFWRRQEGIGNDLDNQITAIGNVRNRLDGEGGADTINGGSGADELRGGPGDDVLLWDPDDTLVNGQSDTDTLLLFVGTSLDLNGLAGTVIRNFEVIDLGPGASTLTLALADVLAISSTTDTLKIDGDGGDTLTATDAGSWVHGGNAGGYDTWTQGATAILLVDQDINTNFVA